MHEIFLFKSMNLKKWTTQFNRLHSSLFVYISKIKLDFRNDFSILQMNEILLVLNI